MQTSGDGRSVGEHYSYGQGGLLERIAASLVANGLDPQNLTPEDLAPVDQFHSRGRQATLDLADVSGITAEMRVLDVGGGLGGPARTLASQVGCTVEVLDLTEEFCRVGRELTARTGLDGLVFFTHGNALDIPFPAASFDAVWTQHSTMNIPDKPRLYSEIRRVLKPGGKLVMHEIFTAGEQDIHFPVPWAKTPAISHLVTQEEARETISESGFRNVAWTDETDSSAGWFRERAARMPSDPPPGPPPPGLPVVLGPAFKEMFGNQVRNLAENRISVARGVFEATSA
ncbi:class I SAM-dependent methyltransferase [Rubrobacter indicoceani]|uniref:class I SAM-dependent methyltransferase n=1 Tax=Rubrobacter indicoceani TaxID=2051957 RepID=UPI000E5BFC74|nr:methyltransferase domain-containing protein [Rubrobacter indicoceani]